MVLFTLFGVQASISQANEAKYLSSKWLDKPLVMCSIYCILYLMLITQYFFSSSHMVHSEAEG